MKNYIVEKGIDPKRAKAFGMGPDMSKIAINNPGDMGTNQLNRRVEIELNLNRSAMAP